MVDSWWSFEPLKAYSANPALIIILSVVIVISSSTMITLNSNFFGTASGISYNRVNQMGSNITNSIIAIQNIPTKKVHVGDIDIAYKILGKGKPIILIGGVTLVM